MPVVTLGDYRKGGKLASKVKKKRPELKGGDDDDDNYKPGRTLADDDTDEDADLLDEVAQDYSDDDWEEEDENGNITIHKGGGPSTEEVETGLQNDERWSELKNRAEKRFRHVIEKGKMNSIQSNQTLIDVTVGPKEKYAWKEDPEGTHVLEIVGEPGKERKRYRKLKAKELAAESSIDGFAFLESAKYSVNMGLNLITCDRLAMTMRGIPEYLIRKSLLPFSSSALPNPRRSNHLRRGPRSNPAMNSSDVEFEPAEIKRSNKRPGRASIAQIIENADKDRLSSKRTTKQLQFGRGAPGTRSNQELWVERFNAFRQTTLGKSLDKPFSGDDLIRFFDAIIDKVRPVGRNKPAPNDDIIHTGLRVISAYGTFTYSEASGYRLTRQDGERLNTFVADAVKEGRLLKGNWHKRVWLNFMTVSRMAKAWLEHHHKNGTLNWDVSLARLLSIVLVTSLGCRSGDAVQSHDYTGTEYMQWRHIDLMLDGNEANYEDLRAHITVEYPKGSKDVRNEDLEYYLRPLDNPKYHHMDPIALLLVHALRHGLVHGSTIQQILENASKSPNRKVVWLFPNHPVLPAFTAAGRFCQIEIAAKGQQLLSTIKQMGIVSNILTRVHVHGLRTGSAKDVAHLPAAKDGSGFVTNEVRQALGHSSRASQKGVTETYVGAPTREYYNDRVEREFVDRWGPKFSEVSAMDIVKKPITPDEMQAWQELNVPRIEDRDTYSTKRRARWNIERDRLSGFIETAEPEAKGHTSRARGKGTTMSEKSSSEVNIITDFVDSHRQQYSELDDTEAPLRDPVNPDEQDSVAMSLIDPRLLDLDLLQNADVDKEEIEALNAQVLLKTPAQTMDQHSQEEESVAIFLEEQSTELGNTDKQSISTIDFISAYSAINVINNCGFALAWRTYSKGYESFDESIGQHSARGNSRADPTPMIHHCRKTQGCDYQNPLNKCVLDHERSCREERVAAVNAEKNADKSFVCGYDGCDRAFSMASNMTRHRRTHTFEPKPCPRDCDPEKLFTTEAQLKKHMLNYHDDRWPKRCEVPGCESTKTYKAAPYAYHLQVAHGGPSGNRDMRSVWEPTACPVEDCTNETVYITRKGLRSHLTKKHAFTKAEALELAMACGTVYRPAAEVIARREEKKQRATEEREAKKQRAMEREKNKQRAMEVDECDEVDEADEADEESGSDEAEVPQPKRRKI